MRFLTLTPCILLYALVLIKVTTGRPKFEMAFDACDCNRSEPDDYLSHLSCGVSKNTKRRSFQFEMEFKKDVKQFLLNMRMNLPRKGGDFVLFNVQNVSGCQMLAHQNQILFLQLIVQSLNRFGNIPSKCPFQKDVRYYIKGFRVDMNAFPALTFETDMSFFYNLIVENKKIMQCLIKMHFYLKRNNKAG